MEIETENENYSFIFNVSTEQNETQYTYILTSLFLFKIISDAVNNQKETKLFSCLPSAYEMEICI